MNRILAVFLVIVLLAIGSSFLIPGVREQFVRLGVMRGTMDVTGLPPQVIYMLMQDKDTPALWNPLPYTVTGSIPSFDGNGDRNRTLQLNATVYDPNGDCQGGFVWYICTNDTGSTCNSNVRTYTNSSATPYTQYTCPQYPTCTGCCCNYTTTIQLEYYRWCGLSRVNGSATDVTSRQNSSQGYWKFNERLDVLYPYDGTLLPDTVGNVINLGGVAVSQWNLGLALNQTKNGANTKFILLWNASNFTGGNPPDVIGITDAGFIGEPGLTTFAVDNDTSRPAGVSTGAGYISPNNQTQINFPVFNLTRCGNYGCSDDEIPAGLNKAKFDLWWHLYIESGKSAGQYNNTIQVHANQTLCGA
jgi:hypothetical protein